MKGRSYRRASDVEQVGNEAMKRTTIAFFLGTYEDWGGASRALLNFVRLIDRKRFRPIVVVTRRGLLWAQLESEQIECLVWEVHDRGRNLVKYAADVWRATRFFRDNDIQIAHINYGAIGWKPAEIIAARLVRVPVINHLHITVEETSSFIRYSSVVLAVSRYVADRSDARGVSKRVVHNVSDLHRFEHGRDLRADLGYLADDVVVAFLGQLIRAKGLEMFIEVVRRINDPRAKFIVAGPLRNTKGAYTEAEVQELVARDPRIRYLGYRSDPENLYATSDIIVMPSQWDEPCAMILFEAAAAGKPIVGTATGGTPEILIDNETGFLVDRTDVTAMTACVHRLIEDKALRARLGEQARQKARMEFAVGPIRDMEGIYDSLAVPRGA